MLLEVKEQLHKRVAKYKALYLLIGMDNVRLMLEYDKELFEQISLVGREFYFNFRFHIVKEVKITEKGRTFLITDTSTFPIELENADFTAIHITK